MAARGMRAGIATAGLLAGTPVLAGSFDAFGLEGSYQLQATYAAAVRLHDADDRIIKAPGAASIPVPDYLKLPESNNYDDGDRNFDKGSFINHRLTLLGEVGLVKEDYGLLLRGDAFYDGVYRRRNSNDSPDTLNMTTGDVNAPHEGPVDRFSDEAAFYDGRRARLLDAYVYGSWYLGEEMALNLRLGRHIAAWGESLFFAGVALAQGPADATKANIPGIDVKSILLPVNQVSMQLSVTPELTLLGQYKLEYKATELNPVGEYFSVADVVGPGAQFTYGLQNPFYLSNLADVNLLSDDVPEALALALSALAPQLPSAQLTGVLGSALDLLDPLLPDANLPVAGLRQPGTPQYINVRYAGEIEPSDHGQYGLGAKYQLTPFTSVGLYWLRYHNTTPAPVQDYGEAPLLYGPQGPDGPPLITTAALGLPVPVTYHVRYFDGIHMAAGSLSTMLFGVNFAGELVYRDGIDVLVDLDSGVLGPVPTPTRSKIWQGLLSGLYSFGPQELAGWPLWDSLSVVGEAGYVHVAEVDEACNPYGCNDELHYSRDAAGLSLLFLLDRKNLLRGWDLTVPVYLAGMLKGQSSLLSGFGALTGEQDRRFSVGATMTYLQTLSFGVSYSGYFGEPHFSANPYADRDNIGVSVKYSF